MVVIQGAVQPLYEVDATAVGLVGVATVPPEFAVLTMTRLAADPELPWMKAIWVPSAERSTEVATVADPVL
jgi:hypothetical protein